MAATLFEPGNSKTPIIAWSLYDFADTSFSALFLTFFFPILIKRYLGGTEFQVGLAMGLSLLLAAFLVPFIGAIADTLGRRIPILAVSTVITVGLIVATGYAGLFTALLLGALANLFNIIDIDLYDSFIPDLAPPEAHGRLSGFGTAIGYLGAIASLAAAYFVLSYFGFETRAGVQAIFPTVAIFYLVFSLPLFFFLRDRVGAPRPLLEAARRAAAELRHTVTHLRDIKGLGPFLLSSFIYNDAMHTAIIFLSLFGTERIGLTIQQFFWAFAVMALAAFAGSLVFGQISDRLRPRQTLSIVLILWMLVIIFLIFTTSWQVFVLAGSLGGALLGAVWTCNRHMITLIAPRQKIAEIFGFEGLTEKAAGVLGPISFGFLATYYGYTLALSLLLVFFIVGFWILRRHVPETF